MTLPDLLSRFDPAWLALVFGLLSGVVLGLAARLGRFCTLGAIEDLLYGGSDLRLRMWGVAIGTAVVLSYALIGAGWLIPSTTLYLGQSWMPLASISGGLIFGYGMALAGNCGFGALSRLGGGDLRALVIVLVMAIAAYMALSGPLARLRVSLFSPETAAAPPSLAHALAAILPGDPATLGISIGALILLAMLWPPRIHRAPQIWGWGLVIGAAFAGGWAGTAWLHNLSFGEERVVSHTFSAPLGDTLFYLMLSSGVAPNFGVGSVAGVALGALIGSLFKGHFRWEACEDPRELRRQIVGAALMGIGGVTAAGCSIGQGIAAFSLLAWSAPVTLLAIFAGAAFGLRQLIEGFSGPR